MVSSSAWKGFFFFQLKVRYYCLLSLVGCQEHPEWPEGLGVELKHRYFFLSSDSYSFRSMSIFNVEPSHRN